MSLNAFAHNLLGGLIPQYHQKLFDLARSGAINLDTFPGFLFKPDKIVFHIGETHVGIEYYGSEVLAALPAAFETEIEVLDHRGSGMTFMESVIGFPVEGVFTPPIVSSLINAVVPTHAGSAALAQLNWNYTAQNMLLLFNAGAPAPVPGQFGRIVNGLFFDGNDSGLITRHIKWLDLFSITINDIDADFEEVSVDVSIVPNLVLSDASFAYPLPTRTDFRSFRLPLINRFVETFGNPDSSEPKITTFLEQPDNQFILTTRFGAIRVAGQVKCEWQSEVRDAIIPDFFVVHADGYADIVEFKFPHLGGNAVVGITNRERLSAKLSEYVAQTRSYREYFDDPNNRVWFEQRYGFKVLRPRRFLVVGRRFDFNGDDWRKIISDFHDLEVVTYDDLVDTATAQFYI
ncbi:Shedu anti-phage system protein SduA domain-containing protein [Kozakia baliensis]|uniref:Shedu anti-phage system protein SduA domain-containing protein n=1 Tax=Kozakia baliensis TaxID=153496 RepID=UPI00087C30B2|nr:Shedu anti-phage system protein SduA domain-containing protein [Kozakia baliensis]AOX20099.1 hypothetical protein A0U90_07085 [Kozakia baliensis]